jgi:hypothetical protein
MIIFTDGFLNDLGDMTSTVGTIGQTGVTTLVVGTYGDIYNYGALTTL